MTGQKPPQPSIEGLQLWLPSDTFDQPHNVRAFQDTMSNFEAITIMRSSGEASLYCSSGDPESMAYTLLTEEGIKRRMTDLRNQRGPIGSCLVQGRTINSSEMLEEARVRELHLGLGRAAIYLAKDAASAVGFKAATHDLKAIFEMINHPIHTESQFNSTPLHASGMTYLFVRAARRHKTLSKETADELAHTISKGVRKFKQRENGRDTLTNWYDARGKGFVDRAGFYPEKMAGYTRYNASQPKRVVKPNARQSYTLHQEKLPASKTNPQSVARNRGELFVGGILEDRRRMPFAEKVALAHDNFIGEQPKAFKIDARQTLELTKLGIVGYLEAMSVQEEGIAAQLRGFVSRRGSASAGALHPIMVAGNLLTAKINTRGGFDGTQRELPGLELDAIPKCFQAIRYFVKKYDPYIETESTKLLGDLVEAYLFEAYSDITDLNYEIPNAQPDDMVVEDFGKTVGLSKGMTETLMLDNGIAGNTLRFGKKARKGLIPSEQALLREKAKEIAPAAPQGYRSISGLSHILHVENKVIKDLIDEHEIETGEHRFGTFTTTSLNPEAQEEIATMLGRHINIPGHKKPADE